MAIFKEVWNFVSGTSTWSDVWYATAPTLSAAANIGQTSINTRLKLLSELSELTKIRVSNIANPRETVVLPVNQVGIPAVPDKQPAPSFEAAVCLINSTAAGARRFWWCSGQDEDSVYRSETNGKVQISADFLNSLKNWFSYLERNDYIVLKQVPVGQQGVVYNRISTVDGTANNGRVILSVFNAPGVVQDNTILISQVNQRILPGLKGQFKVQAVDLETITINYVPPQPQTYTLETGRYKKLIYDETALINATKCGFSHLGQRQRKNFATGSRGAKSAARRRVSA